MFHYIWKSSGRPVSGVIYDCYKSSKKTYRQCCRSAIHSRSNQKTNLISKLYNNRKKAKVWNLIRQSKKRKPSENVIGVSKFVDYYAHEFSGSNNNTEYIEFASQEVHNKYLELHNMSMNGFKNCNISTYQIRQFVQKLKGNTAPGCDGISTEHLKFAMKSKLALHLSNLLTICVKFGVVPDNFNKGILVPILKRNTLDPSVASSYRPVTLSVTFSKLLDLHILDQCKSHQLSDAQFGFIPGRSTGMATALAYDTGAYCVAKGSTVYYASLDVEGAFDFLPHVIIMEKTINIISDHLWFLLYNCYLNMHIQIKWQGHLSQNISVQCGTKQGGLCSTFIFNLFYQNLVDTLQKAKCGVRIGSNNYNCFCNADDILVCSTTVTGLQYLINTATEYVQKHGLNFNSNKTSCMIMGGNPFTSLPHWNIDGQPLQIVKNLRYLGTDFGDLSGTAHCSNRNTASTKAFYGLMRAGIKYPELDSNIVVNIFRSTVQSVTQFGCHSIFVSKRNMLELNKLQGKFVKNGLT